MQATDFSRSRIDTMINLNDPMAVPASRLPWKQIEGAVAQKFEHQNRAGEIRKAQFRRLQRVLKRQRTVLGIVIREVQRKMKIEGFAPEHPKAASDLSLWLERAERIRTQQRGDKNKLYALHAPEVECIGKGKARKPYEFGVKSAVVVAHQHGLMLGARTFPGNPYDGHILSAVLEQATNLRQDLNLKLKQIVVDLGFRGVDADNPDKEIIHSGKFKSLSAKQKKWLKRRTAVEPAIGHLKSDHRMDRCWLQGALGDALHAISCAAGYNLRWLLRAIARLGIGPVFLRLLSAASQQPRAVGASCGTQMRSWTTRVGRCFTMDLSKNRFLAHWRGVPKLASEFCRAD
jgi:IS5 family transposase